MKPQPRGVPSFRPMLFGIAIAVAVLGMAGCASKETGVAAPCPTAPSYPAPPPNPRVIADAGPDYEVKTGDDVFLDGTGSIQQEGKSMKFHWDQMSGPCVKLDFANPQQPTFTAPKVPAGGALLVFRLIVESDGQYSAPDDAEVQVASA